MATTSPIPALAEEATRMRDVFGLSDEDIARATGAGASTARAWINATRTPTGQRAERLIELAALTDRLGRVVAPRYIAVWLKRPIPALDDEKPLDLIARGDYRKVAKIISALEQPPAM
jgi:uncharacterized protein (DUF2384 family)